jgi:hypothetical protein
MLHVSAKEILVCHTFVNSKFNGVLEFDGSVKIRGFDTFSKCKSQGGGYHVSNGNTLKLSNRRRSYGVYIHYVKGYRIRNQWGVRIKNFKVLDILRDC